MPAKRKWTTTKDLEILKTNGNAEAAKILGCSKYRTASMRYRYKIPCPVGRGQYEGKVKLSAEDIAQMMMLRVSGFCDADIARLKLISQSTVKRAIELAEKTGFDIYEKRELLA